MKSDTFPVSLVSRSRNSLCVLLTIAAFTTSLFSLTSFDLFVEEGESRDVSISRLNLLYSGFVCAVYVLGFEVYTR